MATDTQLLQQGVVDAAAVASSRSPLPRVTAVLGLVLGGAAMVAIAARSTNDLAALLVAAAVLFGPGLTWVSFSRGAALDTAAWIAPIGLTIACLGTRILLWTHVYRPKAVAALIIAAVIVGSATSLRRNAPHGVGSTVGAVRRRIRAELAELRGMPHGRWWTVSTAVALIAWIAAMFMSNAGNLNTLGLLGALSPIWYVGLVALVVSIAVALRQSGPAWAVPLAVGCALVFLYLQATGPILFDVPRYTWTYKHIGLADFMATFKDNPRAAVDIYQAWPSFFSAAGTISGSTSINGLVAVARWWPLAIQLSSALLIRRIVGALVPNRAIVWTAVVLFLIGNWIGQDYFSPQSVAMVLGLGVSCIVVTRLIPAETEVLGRSHVRGLVVLDRPTPWRWVVAAATTYAAIVVTHQLTPFLILPGLILAVPLFGLRPRILPAALAAIAVGYALLNWKIVRRQGVGKDLGSVVDNVQTRGESTGRIATRVVEFGLYYRGGLALSAGIGIAALAGAVATRRLLGRRFWGLVGFAGGPVLIIAVEAYGQEGILRVYLMCLPWLVLSAAVWLNTLRGSTRGRSAIAVLCLVGIGTACVVYFDRDLEFHVYRSDVEAAQWYEQHSPAQSILVSVGSNGMPEKISSRYTTHSYVNLTPIYVEADASVDAAGTVSNLESLIGEGAGDVYLAFGPTLVDHAVFNGEMSVDEVAAIRSQIESDPDWHLAFTSGRSALFRWVGP